MPKRFYNPEIFNEDWFIDLPEHYKLFWFFLKSKCDQGGFWRVNKNQYRIVSTKLPLFDDFLKAVNFDGEEPTNRIIVVDKRTWFIPSHISEQCGHLFRPTIGAHRGVLHTIVVNNILPAQVKDFDWQGIENIEFQLLKKLVLGKSWHTLMELLDKSIVIGTGNIKGKGNKEEGGAGGNQQPEPVNKGFKMQQIYDMPYDQYHTLYRPKKLTEEGFNLWKRFVDWIIQMNMTDLFECKFITPKDFFELYEHGFTDDKWESVCRKILSTGIRPEMNLFFRIPDYAEYLKKGNRNRGGNNNGNHSSTDNNNFTGGV